MLCFCNDDNDFWIFSGLLFRIRIFRLIVRLVYMLHIHAKIKINAHYFHLLFCSFFPSLVFFVFIIIFHNKLLVFVLCFVRCSLCVYFVLFLCTSSGATQRGVESSCFVFVFYFALVLNFRRYGAPLLISHFFFQFHIVRTRRYNGRRCLCAFINSPLAYLRRELFFLVILICLWVCVCAFFLVFSKIPQFSFDLRTVCVWSIPFGKLAQPIHTQSSMHMSDDVVVLFVRGNNCKKKQTNFFIFDLLAWRGTWHY